MNATAARPSIFVNDAPRPLEGATTLAALVEALGLAGRKGVALAVNDAVVPRTGWAAHSLSPGDRVLVIRAAQGG